MLGETQGKTIGMMLDFLAKELKRLETEREAHALALLAERARYGREAAESGRRQKELQRLKEHDEMFKQVCISNYFLELQFYNWFCHVAVLRNVIAKGASFNLYVN